MPHGAATLLDLLYQMTVRKWVFNLAANVTGASAGIGLAIARDLVDNGARVVVNARRAERLQDVPISVVVQSGEQLETAGVDNLRDLGAVTPGLTFQAQGNFVQPALRGITTLVTGPGSDNPIALYIDGVYEGTQAGASIDLPASLSSAAATSAAEASSPPAAASSAASISSAEA